MSTGMKKSDVKVGRAYTLTLGGRAERVVITDENWAGSTHVGWSARVESTGRSVRIKDAKRLRPAEREAKSDEAAGLTKSSTNGVAGAKAKRGRVTPSGRTSKRDLATAQKQDHRPDQQRQRDAEPLAGDEAAERQSEPPRRQKKATGAPRLSALDAAAKLLGETPTPLNTKELVAQLAHRGLWSSPTGKTPHATLYAAMLREIAAKGDTSRFVKTDRGLFAARA